MAGEAQVGLVKAAGPSLARSGGARATFAENVWIAGNLRCFAGLLAAQGEDGLRIRAYRNVANRIDAMDRPVARDP